MREQTLKKNIQKAKERIREADSIIITAGAGIGVDSGLPDFRGNEGFWRAYPAIRHLGYSFVDMANPRWFIENPSLAWAFYGHRLELYRNTNPHRGFYVLKEIADSKKDYFIFTSNVDGQFQKAGFSKERIYECHGSIHHFQCTKCDIGIYSAKDERVEVDMEKFRALNIPKCPECGAVARPNILMFNDWQWDSSRAEKQAERYVDFKNRLLRNRDRVVIIEIGAGEHIPTVRYESERCAMEFDGFVIRINPRDYDIDPSLGVGIALGGKEAMERIFK